ncbi:MAG: rRNA pseudouridine synthase [Burkholderiales bacterium]|nr:rRNA pseudouridine synthase [Burkholderiales bacterium]
MKTKTQAKSKARRGAGQRSGSRKGPLRSPTGKPGKPGSRPAGPGMQPQEARPEAALSPAPVVAAAAGSEKLHKVLAQAGLGSRRAMEERIRAGEVTVNGRVATIGDRVTPEDQVKVGGQSLRRGPAGQTPRVLIYHKPEGEIVSNDDPQGRPTVFQHLPPARGGKWLAIGRLDFNTSGLLIFTTSGDLANRMMHPRFEVEREYAVRVLGTVHPAALDALRAGVRLDDGVARFEHLEEEGGEGANRWFRVLLREGRNRIVRRLFESQGLTVSRLMRVRFGAVALPPQLKRGQFIELSSGDVKRLSDWTAQPGQPLTEMIPSEAAARSRPRRLSPSKHPPR